MSDVRTRLTEIMRDVFDDEALTVTDATTAKDVEHWDSLTHVNLIVAVEKTFRIRLTMKESGELPNVGALVQLIERKIAAP
jgi:acyl carrier protein